MVRRILFKVAFILLASMAIQCKHETDFSDFPADPDLPYPSGSCDPDSVYFVNSVLPLLKSSCAMSGCHDLGTAQNGIMMTDYYRIKITGEVKPGNSAGSKLYKVLSKTGESKMPPSPNAELSKDQKAIIAKWIDQGARYNYCTGECNPDNYTFAAVIYPIISVNCKGCHSGNQPSGGLKLDDYTSIKSVADNGKLYGSIAWLGGYYPMPKDGIKLSECNINQIKNWIDNGAPNN
jgi:hypothetical protein